MRLGGLRSSSNVEDRGGGGMVLGGGLGTVVLALVAMYFGVDPRVVLNGGSQQRSGPVQSSPEREAQKTFVSKVLAHTEDTWRKLMPGQYQDPKLVLFGGSVQSACGMAGSATGPFYCPADMNLYIDLSFYDQLRDRLGAPGDFAQAYVIAHEVGHHVQNLEGTLDKVHSLQRRLDGSRKNQLQVRVELQADYYAGVWAHYARQDGLLEMGDVEEGLNAASAIGDDTLQKKSRGYVVPDSFTHGTSEQRVRWFRKGLESGDPAQGDTFNTENL